MPEKVTKSYQDIRQFINVAEQFAGSGPQSEQPDTKLAYALRKMSKKMSKVFERGFSEPLQDAQVELASEDDKKNLLKDERSQLVYTKDNLIALNKKQRELFYAEVEIEPHIVANVDLTKLTPLQRDAFDGFVLHDQEPDGE